MGKKGEVVLRFMFQTLCKDSMRGIGMLGFAGLDYKCRQKTTKTDKHLQTYKHLQMLTNIITFFYGAKILPTRAIDIIMWTGRRLFTLL